MTFPRSWNYSEIGFEIKIIFLTNINWAPLLSTDVDAPWGTTLNKAQGLSLKANTWPKNGLTVIAKSTVGTWCPGAREAQKIAPWTDGSAWRTSGLDSHV